MPLDEPPWKKDPEMAAILREIEAGGTTAMMKYWNDPKVGKREREKKSPTARCIGLRVALEWHT